MTAVRKIEISDNTGVPQFRFDSTGLPERPVIMHQCAQCLHDAVVANKDAGDLAAWLIGEAVDDAHGNGVIQCSAIEQDSQLRCVLAFDHLTTRATPIAYTHITADGVQFD